MATRSINTNNMATASIPRVLKQIKSQLEDEDLTPIVLIGKSGIGKTESMATLAKELGVGFKELRLAHYQQSDLIGVPYVDDNVRTKHAAADILPPSDDPNPGILLLDEVTSADRGMRSAVYQLMDSSRKLGAYKLPKKWLIVACGNGEDDGGDYRGIEPAFLSRARCWRLEENIDAWKDWALKSGVHSTVIAYLTFQPSKLHVMDPDASDKVPACPRNWVKLSLQLKNMELRKKKEIAKATGKSIDEVGEVMIDDYDDLDWAACGCVGASEGPGFCAFYRYRTAMVNIDDIITGKVSDAQTASMNDETILLTIQTLIERLKNDLTTGYDVENRKLTPELKKELIAAINWALSKNLSADNGVMFLQDLLKATDGLTIKGVKVGSDPLKQLILDSDTDKQCENLIPFLQRHKNIRDMISGKH